jgi:hypothetical protein
VLEVALTGQDRLRLRVVYVIRSEERDAARKSRTKLLAHAEQELETIARGLHKGGRRQAPAHIARRVARAVSRGRVGDYLRTELNADARELHWSRDELALAAAERCDGLYALVTNLSTRQASAARVLRLFKEQGLPHRSPIQVSLRP